MTYKLFKISRNRLFNALICLVIVASTLITGCSKGVIPSPTKAPVELGPISVAIEAIVDPSLEDIRNKNPYEQAATKYAIEAYKPDKDLYNTLFNAIDRMEATVDISKFNLSIYEKRVVLDSLYEQVGFQFYYVDRLNLSKDGNSAIITYTDTKEEAEKNKKIFYSRLSHMVYNVAPENYTPLQKLFSVYDYISTHSDYTDNMQDSSTHTAYSLLMKGKAICGGFSILGYYVLNAVGIKTEFISNEPHAWNMVNIDGENYITDITWGAGSYGSDVNFIRNILMDDEQRKLTLDNAGFGDYPIIQGYSRLNPIKPAPATNNQFKAYYDLYFEHALDIDNNRVYYAGEEGIQSMDLDSSNVKVASPMQGTYLKTFNGTLYFINIDNRYLYKLEPGKDAELLDDSIKVESMNIKDNTLYYKSVEHGAKEKTLDLNPFDKTNFQLDSSKHQQAITVPRQQSFKFNIEFSKRMKADILPREAVTLVNKEGEALPIHMSWSEDGHKLTVRLAEFSDSEESVSLYVSQGITAADGSKSAEAYDITVNLE